MKRHFLFSVDFGSLEATGHLTLNHCGVYYTMCEQGWQGNVCGAVLGYFQQFPGNCEKGFWHNAHIIMRTHTHTFLKNQIYNRQYNTNLLHFKCIHPTIFYSPLIDTVQGSGGAGACTRSHQERGRNTPWTNTDLLKDYYEADF